MSASKRLITFHAAALLMLSSTVVLAHDEDADTPWRLTGTWGSRAVFDPVNGNAPLPPLLEVNSIHGDGTVTSFFATQSFGAVGGTHPEIPTNAVGGVANWRWLGHRKVEIRSFRFAFLPVDPNNELNTNVYFGYIQVDAILKLAGDNTLESPDDNHARVSTYSVLPTVCAGLPERVPPCLVRSFTARITLKRFDPFAEQFPFLP